MFGVRLFNNPFKINTRLQELNEQICENNAILLEQQNNLAATMSVLTHALKYIGEQSPGGWALVTAALESSGAQVESLGNVAKKHESGATNEFN